MSVCSVKARYRPARRSTSPFRESSPNITLVDASVEDDVVGGAPAGLGIELDATAGTAGDASPACPPAARARTDTRAEAAAAVLDGKRVEAPTPSPAISAPEWARMSPGARRLYGLDA